MEQLAVLVGWALGVLLVVLVIVSPYFIIKHLGKRVIRYYAKQRDGTSKRS